MKRISLPLLCLGLAFGLGFGAKAVAADGFWILGRDLPLTGQSTWSAYEGGDSPEGGYMGWLYAGTTNLQGIINLNRTLPAGRYYLHLKVINYFGGGKATAEGGLGEATFDNRDWNRYWTAPIPLFAFQDFSQIRLNFLKTLPAAQVQKYLFRGLYITTNAYENLPLFGFDRIVNYTYPTETNTSDTAKGNLIQNSTFEVGLGHGWSFAADAFEREFAIGAFSNTNDSYHGLASVRFPVKGRLLSRIYKIRPNRIHTLSAWVRSSAPSSVTLSMYNVATPPPGFRPVQNISQNFTTGTNWQRISIGGFLPSYPHSDYQVLIKGNTNVWLDAIQLEEGALSEFNTHTPVEIGFGSVQPGRILYEDENPALDLLACNSSAQPFSGTMVFEIFDVYNRKVSTGERPLSVPAGSRSVESFPVPLQRGIFRIVAWIQDAKGTLEESVYAVVPRPRVNGTNESSIIGVHPNLMPFQLAMLERLGMKWARASSPEGIFQWNEVEPVEGQIIWYDEKVDRAAAYGISILGTIGYQWPSWADTNGLPDLDKWESFVERLVTHYSGKVKYWEIWNEPIYTFTTHGYAELLRRAAASIRRADPDAKIVGMGGVYDKAWILEVMGHLGTNWSQHLDYISTHLYGATTLEPNASETEERMVGFKRDVIDRFGVEVWNTESAVWDEGFYKTANSGFGLAGEAMRPYLDSERYTSGCFYQPERILDNFLHCVGNGLTKYFYYDSRIVDPGYERSHPTVLEYDDTIRSKGIAYAIAGHFFDGSHGLGNVSPTTKTYAYLFDQGGISTVGLGSKDKRNHVLRLSGTGWKAFDMMGNEFSVTNGTIQFGRVPVYVQNLSLSVDAMRLAFQSATVTDVLDTRVPNLSIDEFPTGPILQQDISFRWLAIDESSIPSATGPSAVTYSYWLEGRDADWSAWSPGTHVTFPSLDPGEYTFRVKARDAAGNTSPVESRTIAIRQPPAATPAILTSITAANGQITLHWVSIPGLSYQLQHASDLGGNAWINLGSTITANDVTTSRTELIGADRQRFYRVLLIE